MRLHQLAPAAGSKHSRKRVGRGTGSGHGNSSCRGTKGQKAKTNIRPGFEGGQTPLYMRLRKHRARGQGAMPQRLFKREYAVVNVGDLQRVAEQSGKDAVITPKALLESRCIRKICSGLRVLGNGEISTPVTVYAHHFSASARTKIEAAGGRVLTLGMNAIEPTANQPEGEQ